MRTQIEQRAEDRMLIAGDCGLNLELGYDDSLLKFITQTMLNQEEIFRDQVLELHRLYQFQKILMQELDSKVSGGESSHFSVGPLSKQMKCEPLGEMCSSRSMNNHCLQEHSGISKRQRRHLDLELPANHYYTHDGDDLLSESYGCIAPGVSLKMRYAAFNDKVLSVENIELSRRSNSNTWKKRICNDKIICSHSQQAVVSQESTCVDLFAHAAPGYAICVTDSGANHEFDSSCYLRSQKYDAFDGIAESPSLTDGRPDLPEWKHFNKGVKQCHEIISKKKLFTSHDVEQLDLNKVPMDESSFHSIDYWMPNSPKVSSSDESLGGGEYGKGTFSTVLDWRIPINNCSNEPSTWDQQDIVNSTLTTSPSKNAGEHIFGSILGPVDVGSICGFPSESKDLVSCSRNYRPKIAEFEMGFPDKTCQKISMLETNAKKSVRDKMRSYYSSQEPPEARASNRSPVSCKSDLTSDDVSSNPKTAKCGIDMSNSNLSPCTFRHIHSSVVHLNVVPSGEMKAQSPNQKEEELAEVDIAVRKGAVSLIYFLLECSARNQDCVTAPEKREESFDAEVEVPQSSSESYESLVLKQPDCSPDEYCVSSTAFEVTGWDEKSRSIKVKRGRRMKDFRREILPSLASLSRQEIFEDIKIMELAVGSREYRKYKSKNNNKVDCSPPVRRRSRYGRVGRR